MLFSLPQLYGELGEQVFGEFLGSYRGVLKSFMESEDHIYQFGPFCLNAHERVLLREGRMVPLPAKAVSTLLVLVRNKGHVVEKDVLMEEVWPNEFVEEGNQIGRASCRERV